MPADVVRRSHALRLLTFTACPPCPSNTPSSTPGPPSPSSAAICRDDRQPFAARYERDVEMTFGSRHRLFSDVSRGLLPLTSSRIPKSDPRHHRHVRRGAPSNERKRVDSRWAPLLNDRDE